MHIYSEKIYTNQGNYELLDGIQLNAGNLLDVGCGAGDNARILKESSAIFQITGITASKLEAVEAEKYMSRCLVSDIEEDLPATLEKNGFDCIIFSHVLEHLREPSTVLSKFLQSTTFLVAPISRSFSFGMPIVRYHLIYS